MLKKKQLTNIRYKLSMLGNDSKHINDLALAYVRDEHISVDFRIMVDHSSS